MISDERCVVLRYSVHYEELAGRVNPLVFKRYLLGNGWTQCKTKRDGVFVLRYKKDGQFEQVMLPNDPEFYDYSLGLFIAVKDVAKLEGRPIEQVLLTLLNPHSDVIRIRINNPEIETGSISFDAAVDLYENTRKLIAASARDVLHPRNLHTGRLDDSVQKFLSQCRFGQTEIGSYVIPVVCPFVGLNNNSDKQLSISDEDNEEECAQSLTRQVTRHIVEGIKSIISATETKSSLDIPVSANFCDAVASICDQPPETEVDIQVQWSPVVRQNVPAFSSVKLRRDYVAPLRDISKSLKPNPEQQKNSEQAKKIIGRIQDLKADPLPANQQSGQIKVVYLDEQGKTGTLTASLDSENYLEAIEANQKGLFVSMKGTIPEGSKNMDCSSFRIIAD